MPSIRPKHTATRAPGLVSAPLLAFVLLLAMAPAAWAQTLRVSAPLDPALPQAQARQQALDRAFAGAVAQDALRILPAPLSQDRTEALRRFLVPKSRDLVLSYQEAVPKAPAPAEAAAPVPPVSALDYDVEVNRPALRALLQRLGLLSGGTRAYALRLGPGVSEPELAALAELNLLMGLERQAPGKAAPPLDITLERLPQGYYKAVLRQATAAGSAPPAPLAADGADLPGVWQNLFAMLFAGRDFRPGGAARPLELSGWHAVDGVLDFDRLLAGWDESVQDTQLSVVELRHAGPGGIAGRWRVRVVNPARLNERLREALPARGLLLARPEALLDGAARP